MQLKPYWFSTKVHIVWLVPSLEDKDNKLMIEPAKFQKEFPGACLFSRQERSQGLIKCWLFTFKNAQNLLDSNDREYFVYWVDSSLLVEIPML